MKKSVKKSTLIALAIAVVSVLWILSGQLAPPQDNAGAGKAAGAPGDNAGEKKLAEVRVIDSRAETVVNEVAVTGRSSASRAVEIKAEIEGRVSEILFEKGAVVKEGDVLARFEERERKALLDEAKERLAQRQVEFNAAKELESKGLNSRVRLSQAAADLEAARAALRQAESRHENTAIIAPFDGIIAAQSIEVGDYAKIGDSLMRIVDLDPLELRAFVTEHQVRQVKIGVEARAAFIGDLNAAGTVSFIAAAADPQTRTFEIEITLPNPEAKIIDGMTAQISIPGAAYQAHRISPSVLTLNDAGQVGVKIVADGDAVKFAPVRILADRPDYMLIAGLPEEVRLITVGQEFVVEGQIVKPVVAGKDGLL